MSEPDQVEAVEGEERRKSFKPSASKSGPLLHIGIIGTHTYDLMYVQWACYGLLRFLQHKLHAVHLVSFPAQRVP